MTLIVDVISQVCLAIALPYFVLSVLVGVRVARKTGGSLGGQEKISAANRRQRIKAPVPEGYSVFFLMACLNEGVVIAESVTRVLTGTTGHLTVIDDGSDDDTAEQAEAAAAALRLGHRLTVLRRRLPDARKGKGAALNYAYQFLLADVRRRRLDPQKVIVVVMDADGQLSPGAVPAAVSLFEDPSVGGVQLTVRIRKRDKMIERFQDVEFWMISALSQFARTKTGTVSLGGNGQFTRLGALLDLDGDPWSESLTEDLDLGLRLVSNAWKVTTTSGGYVDQQAVDSYRRLLRQRTRWYQGHLSCITRLPEIWSSQKISPTALMEVTSYLLVPWLIVLPWSILQQWVFWRLFAAGGSGIFVQGISSGYEAVAYFALFYFISFLPNLLIGFIYWRRTRAVSLGGALVLAHLMIIWNYIGYVAVWRALYRMIRGRTGWDKTSRTAESVPHPVLALANAHSAPAKRGRVALRPLARRRPPTGLNTARRLVSEAEKEALERAERLAREAEKLVTDLSQNKSADTDVLADLRGRLAAAESELRQALAQKEKLERLVNSLTDSSAAWGELGGSGEGADTTPHLRRA